MNLLVIPGAQGRSSDPDDFIWTGLPIGFAVGAVIIAGVIPWLRSRSIRRELPSLRTKFPSEKTFIGVVGDQPRKDRPVLIRYNREGLFIHASGATSPNKTWSWPELHGVEVADTVRGRPLRVIEDASSIGSLVFVVNDDATTFASEDQIRTMAEEITRLRAARDDS